MTDTRYNLEPLHEALDHRGWKIREAAVAAGISPWMAYKVFSGASQSRTAVRALADALDVPMDALVPAAGDDATAAT